MNREELLENGIDPGRDPDRSAAVAAMADRIRQKDRILEAAFTHAAFDGWTRRTLLASAADCGFDRTTALRLFPAGGDGLIAWIDDWADRQMLAAAETAMASAHGTRGKIAALIRTRFEALAPHKEAVRRAMLARSLSAVGGGVIGSLSQTVDRIWSAVGFARNAEEGSSRYTRRLTLGAVLTSTALYWLEDRSEDHADSWAFLDRRIEDVMRLGRSGAAVRRFTDRFRGLRRSAARRG